MTASAGTQPQSGIAEWLQRIGPGLAICVVLGVISYLVDALETRVVGHALIESLVIAIVLGVVLRNAVAAPPSVNGGMRYASKQVLEASVFLLGASVNVHTIVQAGSTMFALIAFSVIGGLTFAWAFGHLVLKLPSKLAVLVGVGNSICGNSAVAAVAPVIRASSEDVAAAIGITAIMGLGEILLLPLLVPGMNLTNYQYGVIAGIAVYAVPQVVAAAFIVSNLSGQVATLVKLVRVLFLGPMIIVLGILHRERGQAGDGRSAMARAKTYVPWFVAGFLVLAALRTTGVIGSDLGGNAQTVSKWLFIIAMVGLGFGVDLKHVRAVGPRVAATVLAAMSFMIIVSVGGSFLFNLKG